MGTPYDQFLWSRVARAPEAPVAGASGYFAQPSAELDPQLFEGDIMRPEIRESVLRMLYGYWRQRFNAPESWSTVWIAGSALSHQWAADRGGLGDLDVLIGVDYLAFYQANPGYKGITPDDLSVLFNEQFRTDLQPHTANWNGFEVTFYVNPGATDIRTIRPYAAYNLTTDEWTVRPPELPADWNPEQHMPAAWWELVRSEEARIRSLIDNYHRARASMAAASGATWVTAAAVLRRAVDEAVRLFDEIHLGRRRAFKEGGEGFFDYHNFRWQAHKRSGLINALHEIKSASAEARTAAATALYGGEVVTPAKARTTALLWGQSRRT